MDRNRVLERYYAQVAEGVQRFAPPVRGANGPTQSPPDAAVAASAEPGAVVAPTLSPRPWRTPAQVSACVSCRLSEGRTKVLVAPEWRPSQVFVVAESVAPEDDAGPAAPLYAAEKAPSRILASLLERLGHGPSAHRSFATKCLARKGYGHAELRACARLNLSSELAHVRPRVVLAFGARARDALVEVFGPALAECLPSSGDGGGVDDSEIASDWGPVRVVVLPSALELDRWPEWRMGVWERLAFLRL